MKTTLSMQCGAPYIPIPKGRGFTANPDKHSNAHRVEAVGVMVRLNF